jgi:hypothetical protein
MTVGKNGIINQAKEATVTNRGVQVNEEIELWKTKRKTAKTIETEIELLARLESKGLITGDEREKLGEERAVNIGGIEITLPEKSTYNINVTGDNILNYAGEEYLSPGSTYEINLREEDTNRIIDSKDIEWSCDRDDVVINENGEITVSDYSIFGEVTINAKYNENEYEYTANTLKRIQLGESSDSVITPVKYTTSDYYEIFIEDTFSTNGKINAGILPGESGYMMISMNGGVSQENFDNLQNNNFSIVPLVNTVNNYRIIKNKYVTSGDSSSDTARVAKWGVSVLLQPLKLPVDISSVSGGYCGTPEVAVEISSTITETGITIPGMKMSGYIIKTSGEAYSEEEELTYSNGVWKLSSAQFKPNSEVGGIIVINYSIPEWNELTEEEKDEIIMIMAKSMDEDESYQAMLCVTCTQID